jgi:hypothetical protein
MPKKSVPAITTTARLSRASNETSASFVAFWAEALIGPCIVRTPPTATSSIL